jgi:hypothetical protein
VCETNIDKLAVTEPIERKNEVMQVGGSVARCFLVQTYQNVKNIANDFKLFQIVIKYMKWQ